MAITTKTLSALVDLQVAAMQAANSGLLDFGDGSVLLALAQADASVALWLQALVLQEVALTRAATSQGPDLDSFIADFGMTRLPAIAASGLVTFSRFSTGSQAVVQVGATVETTDGTLSFAVSTDATNPSYNASLNAYVLAIGVASISVPVASVVAYAAANVASGAISVIADAIPGVDQVTNPAAFTNGADAESDPAVRVRFVEFINSRSQATIGAVEYAITSTQQNIAYKLVENYAYNGVYQPGYFYIVLDDGSGAPPSSLLSAVQAAVDAVRPICSSFGVFAPVLVTADVVMTIAVGGGYTAAPVIAQVEAAISNYISAAGLGGDILFARLSQVAFDASAGVANVTAVTLNGSDVDLDTTPAQRPMPGTITVTSA